MHKVTVSGLFFPNYTKSAPTSTSTGYYGDAYRKYVHFENSLRLLFFNSISVLLKKKTIEMILFCEKIVWKINSNGLVEEPS